MLDSCRQQPKEEQDKTEADASVAFKGSTSCQSCHLKEYEDWKSSFHYLAMLPANDTTVLGDFNNATYVGNGVSNRFFKKGEKYYIHTEGSDGKYHDFEVQYTFGYYPLQQYLVSFPGGRMQVPRVSWDSRTNKWFHQYPENTVHHKDWLHWTGNSQNWNTMCASCHSTNLKKGYDINSDSYQTTWDEINVGCESCHGPGSNHIKYVESEEYQEKNNVPNAGLVYGKQPDSHLQLNTCVPCHSRKSDVSEQARVSGELLDNFIPQVISNEFYHADGQLLEESYEYGSFTQSVMFHNNVMCSDCHNSHSGKLKLSGNDLCLSCHKPNYNSLEHHFHKADSEGSQCVNCHMAPKTYMVNDIRRDHSFRIPRPDQSVKFGTPNACNGCHTEESPSWASDAVTKWFGPDRAYHFSDDLIPGSKLNEGSDKHLVQLLADTSQPEIARATAAFYLGSMQTPAGAEALVKAIDDLKPLVRYYSVRSLESYPLQTWQSASGKLLNDKVRAVRIASADLYHRAGGIDAVPEHAKNFYQSADSENQNFLHYQADFSVGNIMLADYHMQSRAYVDAVKFYLRGLQKDSLMNYARMNLSIAYNNTGNNSEALRELTIAAKIDPGNPEVYYKKALLHYEMNDVEAASKAFKQSVDVGSTNQDLYYNYGILLLQERKTNEAEKILLKGYKLNSLNLKINYALAFYYLQLNAPQKAKSFADILFRYDASNPDYREIFIRLGYQK
jgi:Flp pilus assembly protein TadD